MIKSIVFVLVSQIICKSLADEYERSVAQANIYYQRPPEYGYSKELQMLDIDMLNHKKDVKLIVHGFMGNRVHPAIVPVKNAYLAQGIDNVFMCDWELAAAHPYNVCRNLISRVAKRFTKILSEFIEKHEIELNDVHLIGHSLGAHIVGIMGKSFNGALGRITGLDPAFPLFVAESPDSLQPNDAKFVDVIHTGSPTLGDRNPRGTVDFYPNYGRISQPGCSNEDLKTFTSCSHYKACQFYAESIGIPRSFPAFPCSQANIISNNVGSCRRAATLNTTVIMGEYIEIERARGEYFLTTNAAPPFGQGENSDFYRNSHFVSEP